MKARRIMVRASHCVSAIVFIGGCSDSTRTIEAAVRTIQVTVLTDGAASDRDPGPTCESEIIVASTDAPAQASQFLVKGSSPAWRP